MKKIWLLLFSCLLFNHIQAQVIINEICPGNGDINYDPDFYNFSGWIELYNTSSSSVNVSGYYLSNDAGNKSQWSLPYGTTIAAKGFLLIWADENNSGRHTNFKLDGEGGTLTFSNSQKELDRVIYPKQFTNVSYGRRIDGDVNWTYLVSPTPSLKNTGPYGTQRLSKPDISLKAGRYSGSQSVTISHPNGNAAIRYTTDGSEPILTSPVYSGPLNISSTKTLKAKAFVDGFIPSGTNVCTYFINEHSFSLPVVSLSMDNRYLYDDYVGIYIAGKNGISGFCTESPVNWNRDWSRHTAFEYFDQDGKKILDLDLDARIGGNCTRNNPQKSLVVNPSSKYGKNSLDHKFFDTKQINEFGGLTLRNGGNDFWYTMFRDELMQTLPIGKMDLDYLAYQPAALYVNGQYMGIQNIREKIDGDYLKSNYGLDKDEVDLIETWGNAIEGSPDMYNSYLSSLQQMDLTSDVAYDFIESNIDVQEYINYMVAEIYYCNTDWPGNNVKFWRQRSGGKFRWILWDTDFGFGLYSDRSYATHATLDSVTALDGPQWPNPPFSTLHLRSLLKNPKFRTQFIQTLTTSLSTTFEPQRVVGMIDAFQNRIKPEMSYHIARWQQSMDNWNYQVQRLRDFALQRNVFMKSHIGQFFGLVESVSLSTESFPASSGGVVVNGITNMEPIIDGFYYKGLMYTAKAAPASGFQFSHFIVTQREVTNFNFIPMGDTWRYADIGNVADEWKLNEYDDNTWQQGPAQLGYGEGDEKTIVSYGPDAGNKYITTYFRKSFEVSDTVGMAPLSAAVLFDDGVIVYLNGDEVYRTNMPVGAIAASTPASTAIAVENVFVPFTIPKDKLRIGTNVIAVEVHQNSGTSSDVSFDFYMNSFRNGAETQFTTNEPEISDVANGNVQIQAYYEPVAPKSGIIINEFNSANSTYPDAEGDTGDWIELHNMGNQAVDLSGLFITDNLANKTKHRIASGAPGETTIDAGGYKIFWADEKVSAGALHLNFKLGSDGESIGIYQAVGSELRKLDELTYNAQLDSTSYSRIPNGTGPVTLTASPTPLAANVYEEPLAAEGSSEQALNAYPNPTTGLLQIESSDLIKRMCVFSSSGANVKVIDVFDRTAALALDDLPSGLYNIVFYLNKTIVTKRIVKK